MTTWRGLFGATLLVAAIAAAGAATDGQDQRLDVPWEGIAVASQQRVREVTEHAIFSRDLHGIQVKSSPTVFDFLLDHPDFAATAGKILGIVKYRIVKERDGVSGGTMPMALQGPSTSGFSPLCRRRWSIEISDTSAGERIGERIVVDSGHDLHIGSHYQIGQ